MWLVTIWVAVLVTAIWLYFQQKYSYFRRRGVQAMPAVPPFGHNFWMLLRKQHMTDNFNEAYKAFPNDRFTGRYEFTTPIILIQDLDLIKQVTVKDFEHFLDHRQMFSDGINPLFGRNLFSLKGEEWKDMRSTLSPAFTSSKIKLMVPFMTDVGDQMISNLKKKIKENNTGYLDVDVKDLTTRFANDVIASCAFGLKVDSHSDPENEFYTQGLIASNFNFKQLLMLLLYASFPKVMNKLKPAVFSESSTQFFRSLVQDTMLNREKQNIIRPDMIHLLMEAKKGDSFNVMVTHIMGMKNKMKKNTLTSVFPNGVDRASVALAIHLIPRLTRMVRVVRWNLLYNGKLSHEEKAQDTDAGFATVEESAIGRKKINRVWSDDDLTAQAVLFFLAGFETISSAMSFLLHELALNPDVQEKLRHEIQETDVKNSGQLDFTTIQQMKYMDMVVSEILRLWSPAIATDRTCLKDYNLGKPNEKAEKDYIIHKGQTIAIPVWPVHRDPAYYPNPTKFDPERFSDENKHKINPMSYMPFGIGPRNCIGSRFALCQLKIMVYMLLRDMEVTPGPKTCVSGELDMSTVNLRLKGGHWLRFKVRS